MRAAGALALLALLAGCATTPPGPRGESDRQRLARECRERDGVLLPLYGRPTGNPGADYACHLSGGAGRRR